MELLNYSIVYHVEILLYACSVSLYCIDYFQSNQRANRIAFWLLSIVWVLHTIFMIMRAVGTTENFILTLLSGVYFYVWLLLTLSLVMNRVFRVDFLVFFTNVIAFGVDVFSVFTPIGKTPPMLANRLISDLVYVHVGMVFITYATFTVSFIFSCMYVLQYTLLKQKKWNNRLRRLGNLQNLNSLSFGLNLFSVPFFLFALLLGCIWAYAKVDQFHWYDPKVSGSFIVLLVYSVGLYLQGSEKLQGRNVANWNIGAFLVLLINLFLFTSLSSFHFWHI
ncbi:cytochrome C assembly family protein [Ectobacillus polymachus]|uniref:cytochrome C assembly family protein n=1 Tax=Ectobacillus polymachus TaxID=1508806 RepID=UPI003A8372D2